MHTTLALALSFSLGLAAAAFARPVEVGPVTKDCRPSGSSCKFGSDCCSKICKASYTCK